MKKIILSLLSIMLLAAACTDDLDITVAPPQTNPQEPAITIGFQADNTAAAFDMADIQTDSIAIAKLSSINIMEGASVVYEIYVSKTGDDTVEKILCPVSNNGNTLNVATADLRAAVEKFYGKRPDARNLTFFVNAIVTSSDQTFQMRSNDVNIAVTLTAPVIESAYYLIGDVAGWDIGDNLNAYKFNHSSQDVYDDPVFTITVQMSGYFKIVPQSSKDAGSWTGVLGNPVDGNTELEGALGTGDGFDGAMRVEDNQWVKISINMMDYAYTIELLGSIPQTLYMIGDEFGGWAWDSDGVVTMTPVNGFEGNFWTIRYISAGKGFKWCTTKAWSGDFNSQGEDIGYTISGGNAVVAESGMYMVYVDMIHGKISVEPAKVYGMGDCFGGWATATYPFAVENRTMTYTTSGSGELRMYAASDISPVGGDWWRMEFVILDGEIAYRGTGGDQARVSVSAGKKITLDFNAGTGAIQ